MITYKIHYLLDDYKDHIIVIGNTIPELQRQSREKLKSRGVNIKTGVYWSEKLEEKNG